MTIKFDEYRFQTAKGTLLIIDDKEVWLPTALIELDKGLKEVDMPEWLAIEKGIENLTE